MRRRWLPLLLFLFACQSERPITEKASPVPGGNEKTRPGASLVVIGNGAPELRSPSVHVAQQDAQTAAKADVQKRLKLFVESLKLPDGSAFKEKLTQNPALSSKIEQALAGYQIVDTLYFSDGSMDLIAQVPLSSLLTALSGEPEKKDALPPVSVIIDARKVKDYAPSLLPALRSSDGKPVFASSKKPEISLATSMDAARSLGKGASVITLSESALSDGELVLSASEIEKVTKAGAAALVIVPPRL